MGAGTTLTSTLAWLAGAIPNYFLNRSWCLNLAYTYARTTSQTFNYSSTYTSPQNPFGTTAGTLVGSSSGKVITQGVTLTINKAFSRRR